MWSYNCIYRYEDKSRKRGQIITFQNIFINLNIEKDKYPTFGRAFTKKLIRETKVLLPKASNEEPDYEFMEDYIKSLQYSEKL